MQPIIIISNLEHVFNILAHALEDVIMLDNLLLLLLLVTIPMASSVEDHLSTLTASLSEVPKMVKLEIEQQSLYLAARNNASTK
uniref:Uncharacterized protein n=1 Tax=Rhizophagus irregularis (strain DAOM 181602 / DAOM 197198 / MUCL 43194) TaxID=747089 RepID=U9T4Z4_RHIID